MNKLNFKIILLTGVLIAVVQQVLAMLLNPFFVNNLQLASLLSLPLAILISGVVTYYMLKGKMKKADAAMNGFLSGLVAVILIYIVFLILLGGSAQVLTLMCWIIGSTVAGYLAGK